MIRLCRGSPLRAIAAALPLALLFSGCNMAFLWERVVYDQSPHLLQVDEDFSSAALQANSRESLRSTIVNVIRSGMTEADIRVTNYPGELTRQAVSQLLNEIQEQEPIGAYTVKYLELDYTRVLSQYTISLNITYKYDEPPAVAMIGGGNELRRAVSEALRHYDPLLTVEMRAFYAPDHDVESMFRSFYYDNPGWAMEMPGISLSLYPEGTSPHRVIEHRIIELSLTYTEPAGTLRRKAERTDSRADEIIAALPDFPPAGDADEEPGGVTAQTLLWLRDIVCDVVLYDEDTSIQAIFTGERQGGGAYTAYGALVDGLAVSEGYAMAFKLLCDKLNLECRVIIGKQNGYDHAWNLVRIGDNWYHIDVELDDRAPTPLYDHFLFDDDTADELLFSGFRDQHPAALPGVWTYENIPPWDAADEPEEADEGGEAGDGE